MLTLVNHEEHGAVQAQLRADFAMQLLQLIAAHPGYQEHHLAGWMMAWYGVVSDTQAIKEWVAQALDWYQQHGHVQREAGGRYTCLPSYVLGGTPELGGRARLCGHPAAEQVLGSFGVRIRPHPVSDTLSNGTYVVVGSERQLVLTVQQRNELEAHGIRCFAAQELAAALPDVQLLPEPELANATPLPVKDGVWQVFQPSYVDGEPWQRVAREPTQGKLARWLPSDDWQGYRDARYFFCVWGQYGVPLAQADVALWQLRLAAAAGYPRTVYWQAPTRTLWLPLGLPAILWQWLTLATLSQAQRVGRYYTLLLEAPSLESIRNMTQSRFQLRWVDGAPRRA